MAGYWPSSFFAKNNEANVKLSGPNKLGQQIKDLSYGKCFLRDAVGSPERGI